MCITMADLKEIGSQIRELRHKRGLTIRETAEIAGVSYQYVSALETGTQERPTLPTLEQVVRALDAELEVRVIARSSVMLSASDHRILERIAALLPTAPEEAKAVVVRTLEMLSGQNKALTA